MEQRFRQIRETPGMIERVTRLMTKRVQACLQMQGGHFFASFVKVIKTENSLYLINEDRTYIYMTFLHYF